MAKKFPENNPALCGDREHWSNYMNSPGYFPPQRLIMASKTFKHISLILRVEYLKT